MPVVVRGAAGLAPGGCTLFACQHNVYSTIKTWFSVGAF